MKSIIRKTSLLLIPLLLAGCAGDKTSNNFFTHNIVSIGYEGTAQVRLADPMFNYQASIEFIKDKIFDNITLGGGLKGKTIGDAVALSEDLHSITIFLSGTSSDKNAKEGTITIGSAAIKAINSEYAGFKFVTTFTMAETTEYKSAF